MYYVYLIVNEKNEKYIGYTSDLRRRYTEHNAGKSKYTSQRGKEWKLVYYEAYMSKELAKARERTLKKSGSARARLYKRAGLQ